MTSETLKPAPRRLNHGLQRMLGRDNHEQGRAATPLELLYDLAFAASFATAGNLFAHGIAEGHTVPAIIGFGFAMFSLVWAWINFSWFASAFDTDDWLFRLLTMVQMAGVVILALGLPAMFESIDHGEVLDNRVMIAGYVVMRVALVCQWLRAARSGSRYRTTAMTYAVFVSVAQILWIVIAILPLTLVFALLGGLVALLVEIAGPLVAESRGAKNGTATPWHAHHIAERYSLLAIIALGEGVFGTIAAVTTVTTEYGWSFDAIVLVVVGMVLIFGMWWVYFMVPAAEVLHVHRERSFPWGYGHFFIFASIAATGAGLHIVAYTFDEHYHVSDVTAVLAVAIPVLIFLLTVFTLYSYLLRTIDAFHALLALASVAVLAASVVMAANGASISVSLLVGMLAPVVVVIGYESVGHRHAAAHLDRIEQDAPAPH
ncbi:low temperature requirement protein LtrA [Pseudoclavibacter sp. JAI123]|uniref:low temperature requirement protein A n=1 Tax=Pseudoclavibacter sp. JAI123 TaxID=2723065 RepID=UPI00181E497F|nr:low temperature requirement protein A [Pseudoclavibacter sp. JAI123]NYF13083.1 low temperature requirement protein LtrA [Pseudoclavibacter sp. JAI123]